MSASEKLGRDDVRKTQAVWPRRVDWSRASRNIQKEAPTPRSNLGSAYVRIPPIFG
jgi:hypothetical protein